MPCCIYLQINEKKVDLLKCSPQQLTDTELIWYNLCAVGNMLRKIAALATTRGDMKRWLSNMLSLATPPAPLASYKQIFGPCIRSLTSVQHVVLPSLVTKTETFDAFFETITRILTQNASSG